MTHRIEELKDNVRYLEEQARNTANLDERNKITKELTEARAQLSRIQLLSE